MKGSTKKIITGVKDYVIIILGIVLYVLGWSIFLLPNNLIGGGVTGFASIIQYATHGAIKAGYTYFVLNAVLLVVALFTLGRSFGMKSVVAMLLASFALNYFQEIIPRDIIQSLATDNGKLMCTIMGGIIIGISIGLTMSVGGSTGGTDIIALIVNKYRNVSPGRMIMWLDAVIILSSLLIPSYTPDGALMPFTEKITTVIYGFVYVGVTTTTLDMFLTGSKRSVQLFILSKKYETIADIIANDFHRGVTVLDGEGWYTKQRSKVLMVITRKTDVNALLKAIKSVDPNAFLSVTSATGVYGKGFDSIKGGKNKSA